MGTMPRTVRKEVLVGRGRDGPLTPPLHKQRQFVMAEKGTILSFYRSLATSPIFLFDFFLSVLYCFPMDLLVGIYTACTHTRDSDNIIYPIFLPMPPK